MNESTKFAPIFSMIRENHVRLYDQLLRKYEKINWHLKQSDDRYEAYFDEVRDLLKSMYDLSTVVVDSSQTWWLTFLSSSWDVAVSTLFDAPPNTLIFIKTESPSPTLAKLSDSELEERVKEKAQRFSTEKSFGYSDTQSIDWHFSEVYLASEFLDGTLNFARQIDASSYWRLENIWMDEVIRLKAYHTWERLGKRWGGDAGRSDYYEESERYHQLLANPVIKATATYFQPLREYISSHYLHEGKLNLRSSRVKTLINRKFKRIRQSVNVGTDEEVRHHVVKYVTAFYENVIPAVEERSDSEKKSNIRATLSSFATSQAHPCLCSVIDCFEAAIAIYFIDASVVRSLWKSGIPPRVKMF